MRPFDASGAFVAAADGERLRHLAIRGAGVTVFSNAFGLAVQIIATVVLARLLTPNDFGLVTMVTTFSLLLANFGGNGFTEGILQRPTIDSALASNLFWINVGMGLVFTIAFGAAGSLMARFYGNPRVAQIALGMSLTIFLTSTSVLHLALLRRDMRFSTLSALEIFGRSISVTLSIALAWAGWRYWALVAGAVAQSLTMCLGGWLLCQWIPGRPRRVLGTGSLVRFAINIYGRFSVNYFARNMDNLLVGWRFNAQSLGFYKKAYDLFALSGGQLVTPLTSVAVSALSRLNKDAAEYKRSLIRALEVLAFIGMGVGAVLTLVGKDVIRLLLGPGWEPAGRIFTFFGPGIGVMLLYYTHGWIHLSIGRADRWFRWGLVEFTVTMLLFLLALQWGPSAIALAWTASFWILLIPAFWYAGRPIHFGVSPVITAVWKYILASVLAGGASAAVIRRLPVFVVSSGSLEAAIRIVIISVVFGISYLVAVILLYQGCGPLYHTAGLFRKMLSSNVRTSGAQGETPVPS